MVQVRLRRLPIERLPDGGLNRAAALLLTALTLLISVPARAGEHLFPGLKLTIDVPSEWVLESVGGGVVLDPGDNVHDETHLADLLEGDFAPLVSFTRQAERSTFYPMIRFFALKRGSDAALDRARWTMSNALSEKRTFFSDFKVLSPPRKFRSGSLNFYFSEVTYTMFLDDGKEHGVFDQLYSIDGGAMLIFVDVKTAPQDLQSRIRSAGLMKWLRFD